MFRKTNEPVCKLITLMVKLVHPPYMNWWLCYVLLNPSAVSPGCMAELRRELVREWRPFRRKKMDNSFPKASEGFIVCKIAISTDDSETMKWIEFLCFDWMTKFALALYTLVCEFFCFASLSEKTYCFIIICIVSRRMQSWRFNAAYAWWQAQDLVDNTCCKSLLKLTLLFYQDLFDFYFF